MTNPATKSAPTNPFIRFPGFYEDWLQTSLGEIANFRNGKAHEQDISEGGKYIVVNSKFISTEGKVKKYSNRNISHLNKNDIAIVMSDIPNGKALAKCYLIESDDKYTLNQRIGGISSKKADSEFLYRIINRNKYYIQKDNGVSQTNLRKDEILDCPLFIPQLNEQQKISTFLATVDSWIKNLRSQKSSLEAYKKSILQKIFSQEIRFKDDDGKDYPEWEEKRLVDFTDLPTGDGNWILSKDIADSGKYAIVQLGNIGLGRYKEKRLKTISETSFNEIGGTLILKGDLLINRMVDDNLYCCIFPYSGNYITSVDVCWIRKNLYIDNYYLMNLILYEESQNKLLSISSGSGRVRISRNNLFNQFIFTLPSLEEQLHIANFLTSIDKSIKSKEKEIAESEKWKKGLMQQMFV